MMAKFRVETNRGTFEVETEGDAEPTANDVEAYLDAQTPDAGPSPLAAQPSTPGAAPFTPARLGNLSTPQASLAAASSGLEAAGRFLNQPGGMTVGGETPRRGGLGLLVPESLVGRRRSAEGPQEYVPGSYPLLGQTVGSIAGAVLGPVGSTLGGALGATAGKGAEAVLQENRQPTMAELAKEGALSIAPDIAAQVIPPVGRRLLAETPGGQILRREEAAGVAQRLGDRAFQPPPREQIDRAFAMVRESGLRIDTGSIRATLGELDTGKLAALRGDLARIDRQNRSGGKLLRLVDGIVGSPGSPRVVGADIGDLQDLRSNLRKYAENIESPEGRDLLANIRETVDDAIDSGLSRGTVKPGAEQAPEILRNARRAYAQYRSAEDLSVLVEKHITTTPNGKTLQLNTTALFNQLRRPAQTGLASDVQRALAQSGSGAKERLEEGLHEIGDLMLNIESSVGSDTSGLRRIPIIGFASRWLADAMLSETGRGIIKAAQQDGEVSLRVLQLAATAARREAANPSRAAGARPRVDLPALQEFRGIPETGSLRR